MNKDRRRKLGNGQEVDVGQNKGLRKLCACERRVWAKCPHSWYFNFAWKGRHYRFSLDRYHGRHVDSKTAAETLAELIRVAIRSGAFDEVRVVTPATTPIETAPELTFEQLALRWMANERVDKVPTARIDGYRLQQLFAMTVAEGGAWDNELRELWPKTTSSPHSTDCVGAGTRPRPSITTCRRLSRWSSGRCERDTSCDRGCPRGRVSDGGSMRNGTGGCNPTCWTRRATSRNRARSGGYWPSPIRGCSGSSSRPWTLGAGAASCWPCSGQT